MELGFGVSTFDVIERRVDSSVLLTYSRSEVGTKMWLSKVSGSKLVLLLNEHEVESSFDEK